jgi:hypothetical protein
MEVQANKDGERWGRQPRWKVVQGDVCLGWDDQACSLGWAVRNDKVVGSWARMTGNVLWTLLYCYVLEWCLLSDATMQMDGLSATPHNNAVHYYTEIVFFCIMFFITYATMYM